MSFTMGLGALFGGEEREAEALKKKAALRDDLFDLGYKGHDENFGEKKKEEELSLTHDFNKGIEERGALAPGVRDFVGESLQDVSDKQVAEVKDSVNDKDWGKILSDIGRLSELQPKKKGGSGFSVSSQSLAGAGRLGTGLTLKDILRYRP